VSLTVKPRLAFATLLCATAIFAADGGSGVDAGAPAPANPPATAAADAGARPAHAPNVLAAMLDAGADYNSGGGDAKTAAAHDNPALKSTGGSHCKMVRVSDHRVLIDRHSPGSIMDCQEEVRAEARTKFCRKSRERIDVMFSGDWNGIAMDPITMHVWCPYKEGK